LEIPGLLMASILEIYSDGGIALVSYINFSDLIARNGNDTSISQALLSTQLKAEMEIIPIILRSKYSS